MATSPQNLMQTANNVAATLASAFVQAGLVSTIEEAKTEFASVRDDVFATLKAEPGDAPRSSGGGGGRSSGGPRSDLFTAENARATAIRFGAFYNKETREGLTLGEIEALDHEGCAEYGYTGKSGNATGIDYIKYLANNKDEKASYMRKMAEAILEDRRASSS